MPPCNFVKWFTKCLFYSRLLKICTGLWLLFIFSPFFSRNVLQMFPLPRGLHLSPHASNRGSNGSCLCLEAKTGAHTTKSDFFFFFFPLPALSDEHISEFTHHLKDEHKWTFTTGKHLTEDRYLSGYLFTFLQPYVCLCELRREGGQKLWLVWRCSLTTCKVASIPT